MAARFSETALRLPEVMTMVRPSVRQRRGKRRRWRLGEAGLHHGLFKPRQAAFKEWKQGLRGGVAGGEPCAAAGKDEIVSLTECQFHDKGTQCLRIVWNHETLLVAERQFGAGVGAMSGPLSSVRSPAAPCRKG